MFHKQTNDSMHKPFITFYDGAIGGATSEVTPSGNSYWQQGYSSHTKEKMFLLNTNFLPLNKPRGDVDYFIEISVIGG